MSKTKRAKDVVVLVREAPADNPSDGEALRMALGLEIGNHRVTVIFLERGVYYAIRPGTGCKANWFQYLDYLLQLGHNLCVGEESLRRAGLSEEDLVPGVGVIAEDSLAARFLQTGAVIGY